MSDQQPPAAPGEPPYGSAQPPYGSPASPYGTPAELPYGAAASYGSAAAPAPYGYAAPGPQLYGVDPATGVPWSDKTRTTAGLLSLLLPFVGVCGVGRLYTGHVGLGLTQLIGFFVGCLLLVVIVGFVIVPAVFLWSVVDGIILLSSGGTDRYGRRLR